MPRDYRNEAEGVIASVRSLSARLDARKASLYIEEILSVNEQLGLVSKRGTDRVLAGLLRISVSMWEFLEEKHLGGKDLSILKVIDIGSGAGFPGIVWKLMTPSLAMTLVERRERKAAFLEKMALVLQLDRLEVFAEDARTVARLGGRALSYDVAVTTAVAPPSEAATLAGPLLKPGGVFLTLRRSEEKVFPGRIGEDLEIKSAETAGAGTFLLYEKTG
jgi:16S rRNA (guanine527-N7)-methyltransferase